MSSKLRWRIKNCWYRFW